MDSVPVLPDPGGAARRAPPPALMPDAASRHRQAQENPLDRRLVPAHFNVSGNTVVPLSEIAPILEPLVGKSMTVAQLAESVGGITRLYQDRGYLLSFALLQNQDFHAGVVEVTLVEGYVDRVDFQGDAGPAEARLRSLAAPLLDDRPLTRKVLERVLNLMRQVPGIEIEPRIDLPKYAGGGTPLVLVARRGAFRAEGGLADMGSGQQPLVGVTTGSLTPLGEQVRLTAAVPVGSHDVKYVSGEIAVPIGHDGLEAVIDGYYYTAHPRDSDLERLDLDRRVVNERVGLGLRYPLILDNRRSLTAEGGFYAARSLDEYARDADNLWISQRSDLRVLRAGLRYKENTGMQSRDIAVNIYRGLDGLGATQRYRTNLTPDGQPVSLETPERVDFTRYTLDLRQAVALPGGFGLTFSGFGQYSPDPLPTQEQVSFGAWRYGLGYPQGELAGDKGYGVSLELNRRFLTGWKWVGEIQPYVKVDHARAWFNHPEGRVAAAQDNPALSSAAIGARITDNRHYVFDVNVAKPVGDPAPSRGDRDIRFNASYSLLYGGR